MKSSFTDAAVIVYSFTAYLSQLHLNKDRELESDRDSVGLQTCFRPPEMYHTAWGFKLYLLGAGE